MDMEKKHTFLSHTNIFKMNNSAAEQVIMGALSPKWILLKYTYIDKSYSSEY